MSLNSAVEQASLRPDPRPVIRVGAHPNNVSLSAFAQRPDLTEALAARGVLVDIFNYNAGHQTLPLLHAGALDLVGTGSTPPLVALAQGLDVVMIAATPPRGDPGGLLVLRESGFDTVRDLAGRSIAIMPTSWHPHYLIKVLRGSGLTWDDVTVVELNDQTAHEALLRGRVDAWVATGTEAVTLTTGPDAPAKTLAEVSPFLSNRSVLWATRAVVERWPAEVRAVVESINEATVTGGPGWWQPISVGFIAEQSEGAQLLADAGVLSHAPDVATAVVHLSNLTPGGL